MKHPNTAKFFALTALVALSAPPAFSMTPEQECTWWMLLPVQSQRVTAQGNTLILHNGSRFRHFAMEPYTFGKGYNTTRYYPTRAVKPEEASVTFAFGHGMNADVSQAGSMFNAMNAVTKAEANIEPGSPMDLMRGLTKRVQNIYAETIDLPGCGNNTEVSPLNSYEGILDFYTQYLRDLKRRSGGKPLIAVGYCYSSGFLIEVNRRNPGLIDGMALTGLIVPEKATLDFSVGEETKMYANGSLIKNPAVQARADSAYAHLPWASELKPTGTVPTVILTGQLDPFQNAAAFEWFNRAQQNNPEHLRVWIVPGAGHGVLGPVESHPTSYVQVLVELNELARRVLHTPD